MPSLAKAPVVGLADVNLPNNLVDFPVTDENEPNFSYLAALSPTTFTISTTEASQTPILLLIEGFYGGTGGADLSNEDSLGGTATDGRLIVRRAALI